MDELNINNSVTLYKRITPALNTKVRELKKNNIDYIRNEDIWNFLQKYKWKNNNPSLDMMVDDILNLNNSKLDYYVKEKKINKREDIDIEVL